MRPKKSDVSKAPKAIPRDVVQALDYELLRRVHEGGVALPKNLLRSLRTHFGSGSRNARSVTARMTASAVVRVRNALLGRSHATDGLLWSVSLTDDHDVLDYAAHQLVRHREATIWHQRKDPRVVLAVGEPLRGVLDVVARLTTIRPAVAEDARKLVFDPVPPTVERLDHVIERIRGARRLILIRPTALVAEILCFGMGPSGPGEWRDAMRAGAATITGAPGRSGQRTVGAPEAGVIASKQDVTMAALAALAKSGRLGRMTRTAIAREVGVTRQRLSVNKTYDAIIKRAKGGVVDLRAEGSLRRGDGRRARNATDDATE